MEIDESVVRRIIREEAQRILEAPGEAPRPGRGWPMMSYTRPGVSDAERDFAKLVRDLGADEFARRLVRALGDSERAESLARFIAR